MSTCTVARRAFTILALALLPGTVACGDHVVGPGRTQDITIRDAGFTPQLLQTVRRTTVRWTNAGSEAHNVVATNGEFDSAAIAPGSAFSYTFDNFGVFTYRCTLHPEEEKTATITID